jgi:uncharacterized membrane protein YfhO
MLNTKYIIYNEDAPPIINSYGYGNVWFVKDIKFVTNADEEILKLPEMDYSHAVVQYKYSELIPDKIQNDSIAKIRLIEYRPNHLTYKSETSCEQVAIFSEIYYDAGWNAYINNKPIDYFKANYLLRGLKIPTGENIIEFKFEPKTYYLGRGLSKAGSFLIILFILGIIIYEKKNSTNAQTANSRYR